MRAAVAVAAALGATACASFEDPAIVLDLRVLAMRAEPPEQVVDVPPGELVTAALLDQLTSTSFEALVADPAETRPLRWAMTACLLDEDARCDRTRPLVELGAAVIDDPDTSAVAQRPRATLVIEDPPTRTALLAMFLDALDRDPVQALGGIEYGVELRVGPLDGDRAGDVVAIKRVRVAARIPATREPNRNPFVVSLDGARGGAVQSLPPGARCGLTSSGVLPTLAGGQEITLFPVEPPGVREAYVAPTLDGQVAELTETVEYQWLSVYGSFSDEFTGGGRDLLGNQSLLGSDWRAPRVNAPIQVPVWMIQRDERFGVSWIESCIQVVP